MMKIFLSMVLLGVAALSAVAQQKLTVTYVAKNAVRVRKECITGLVIC